MHAGVLPQRDHSDPINYNLALELKLIGESIQLLYDPIETLKGCFLREQHFPQNPKMNINNNYTVPLCNMSLCVTVHQYTHETNQ